MSSKNIRAKFDLAKIAVNHTNIKCRAFRWSFSHLNQSTPLSLLIIITTSDDLNDSLPTRTRTGRCCRTRRAFPVANWINFSNHLVPSYICIRLLLFFGPIGSPARTGRHFTTVIKSTERTQPTNDGPGKWLSTSSAIIYYHPCRKCPRGGTSNSGGEENGKTLRGEEEKRFDIWILEQP